MAQSDSKYAVMCPLCNPGLKVVGSYVGLVLILFQKTWVSGPSLLIFMRRRPSIDFYKFVIRKNHYELDLSLPHLHDYVGIVIK